MKSEKYNKRKLQYKQRDDKKYLHLTLEAVNAFYINFGTTIFRLTPKQTQTKVSFVSFFLV